MAKGIVIQHRTIRSSALVLVPNLKKPIPNARPCRVCKVPHLCKTTHLSLSPTGSAIVSEGVLAELREAGIPDFDVVGDVGAPPSITVGPTAKPRAEQDHQAYAHRIWRDHGRSRGRAPKAQHQAA